MIVGRLLTDRIARTVALTLAGVAGVLMFGIAAGLYIRSRPILASVPLERIFLSTSWHPADGEFGLLAFVAGTFCVTGTAIVLAVPPCLLTAIYLAEYAPRGVKHMASPLLDLLAGTPSVVYGFWGVLAIVPLIKARVAPFFGAHTTGYCVLAGGAVLAVMIVPILVHVCLEVMQTVPREMREASNALGATHWQTVKHVVLRRALPGHLAAVVLAVSRALGETMAVLMVVGNVPAVPSSLFDPAYPLPALIANNYGEMLSVPLYESALMTAALALFLIIVIFNCTSRAILLRVEKGQA